MKKLFLTVCAFTMLALPAAARADLASGFCQSGPVIASCPGGTPSNTSIAVPSAQLANSSVAFSQSNGGSITGSTTSNQSVVSAANNSQSVGFNGALSNGQSVAVAPASVSVSVAGSSSSVSVTGAH